MISRTSQLHEPGTTTLDTLRQYDTPTVSNVIELFHIRPRSAGYTDGRALNAAGIPTYGISGLFGEGDGGGVHGLNERVRVESVYDSRDFLYDLVREYAMQAK